MYLILLIILAASMLLLTKTNIGKRALTLTMAMMLQANPNTNVTTQTGAGQDLSPEMKTYYNKNLNKICKTFIGTRAIRSKETYSEEGWQGSRMEKERPVAEGAYSFDRRRNS